METVSLYSDYVNERLGETVIEEEWGFISFHVEPALGTVILNDIYIRPEDRKKGRGVELVRKVEQAVKAFGCNTMIGYIWPSANGSTLAMRAALANGFSLHGIEGPGIILKRSLEV